MSEIDVNQCLRQTKKRFDKLIEKENNKIKLLPCPFCGGEARLQQRKRTSHAYYVICKNCGCRTPFYQYQFDSAEKLREEATAAWNTRKPVDAVLDRLEDERLRYFLTIANTGDEKNDSIYEAVGNVIDKANEIIKEELA